MTLHKEYLRFEHYFYKKYVNFTLPNFRFTSGKDDVHSFTCGFLRDLLCIGPARISGYYSLGLQSPLKKKILLLPYSTTRHRSLFVVVNPGLCLLSNKELSRSNERACIIHLDPSPNSRKVDEKSIGRSILSWLNYICRTDDSIRLDGVSNPFSCSKRGTMPILSPKGRLHTSGTKYDSINEPSLHLTFHFVFSSRGSVTRF